MRETEKRSLRARLGKEWLYYDGGTGSLLQEKGLKSGELPERWDLERPEDVTEIAESYFRAGADIVNTNTFGANYLHYPDRAELEQIVRVGVRHVREGLSRNGRIDSFVALDLGSTGHLLKPMGDPEFETYVEIFAEVVRWGKEEGADLVLIETMSDAMEAKAAVLAAKESPDLPVFITVVFDEKDKTLTDGIVESVTAVLEGFRIDALDVNYGPGPAQLYPIVKALTEVCSIPIVVNPNAGLPHAKDGKTYYGLSAEKFSDEMEKIASLDAQVLGGCCGTTPKHVHLEIQKTRELSFCKSVKKHRTVASPFSQIVVLGKRLTIIGERINPTGKKHFKEAFRNGDIEYILEQDIEQEDAGADMLDMNVGLPELNEPDMMETVMTRLQGVTALPLQLDMTNLETLERGLRLYHDKVMISSVNGKEESLEIMLPLVAKYGGVVVGLALDEGGIPENAKGCIRVVKKIYARATAYGIPSEDIIINDLAMTISTDDSSANVTLEALCRVRDELHGHSILGVSNIFFSLPQRELVNSFFFAPTMKNGLSCAITNPSNEAMMAAYRSHLALSGFDQQCQGYITEYAGKANMLAGRDKVVVTTEGDEKAKIGSTELSEGMQDSSLIDAIRFDLGEKATEETKHRIAEGEAPLNIVNRELISALNMVGKGFEKGTLFLLQLLMSAEAAKAAFEVIKSAMSGTARKERGSVTLATVKGDIHDIGKNIVKVLMENYGYKAYDLGRNVPAEITVETAITHNVRLIGLSVLMTTTVVNVEDAIKLIRERKPNVRVVVGGAVMTKEYADDIGADCYVKEAIDTVRYADTLFPEVQRKSETETDERSNVF